MNVALRADVCRPTVSASVCYYGYYSNRSRGARRLIENGDDTAGSIHIDEPPANTRRKAAWARLIQKAYEVDPLECVNCGSNMRITPCRTSPEEYSGETVRPGDGRIAEIREIGQARPPDRSFSYSSRSVQFIPGSKSRRFHSKSKYPPRLT